jgi:uncharacterized protein with PIN domain
VILDASTLLAVVLDEADGRRFAERAASPCGRIMAITA